MSAGVIPPQHRPTTSPHSSPRRVVAGLGDSTLLQFTRAQQAACAAPPLQGPAQSPGGGALNQPTNGDRSGGPSHDSSSTPNAQGGPLGVWVYDAGRVDAPGYDAGSGVVGGAPPHAEKGLRQGSRAECGSGGGGGGGGG
eukprot:1157953-Pelagomonas_calceolata.AAC.6